MTRTAVNVESKLGEALARAMTYRLLARAFGRPDAALLADLRSGAFFRDLGTALRALPSPKGLLKGLRRLRAPIGDASLEQEHTRLFNPSVNVQAPPYETEYGGAHVFMKAQQLADTAGFYRAFGLQVAHAFHDRPDHVAVELEFMHAAVLQEGRALARSQAEKAAVCRDAQAKFLNDHLGRWLPTYAERLQAEDPDGFYAALASLTRQFVAAETARLGVEPAPTGRYRPRKPEPTLECPAAGGEACVQP